LAWKWRQERALHDRRGPIRVHDTFLTKRVKKDEKNSQKPYKLTFRTCCVHHTANLNRYSCFSCNLAPGTCVKRIKKPSQIIKHMAKTNTYIFTLFWHFWAEILMLFHVWPDLVHFKASNQKNHFN
jgi:hypothetical protein